MKRCTTGLLEHEAALVSMYATPDSEAHIALDALVPEVAVHSESSAIRALLLAGHRAVEEERLRLVYDRAVGAGEIDEEALAWYAAASRESAALIVSNNGRNRSRWPYVHVVLITSAPKEMRDTIVDLPGGEPVAGRVICDDLAPVPKAALGRGRGGLSPATMRRVDEALKRVLALN